MVLFQIDMESKLLNHTAGRIMQAIEFEIDINDEFIRIPHFEQLKDKHVKIILLYNEEEKQESINIRERNSSSITK